jgi:ferritin-like metal-binding protein YciE
MADVTTETDLLINALQDLHDAPLRSLLDEDAARSAEQQRRVAHLLERREAEAEGAPNIWLRAILDDADRDSETVERGVLLDIALLGAIRKGKQAERVSYETAITLAQKLGGDDAPTLELIRDEEAATDAALAEILLRLTA